MPIITFLLTSCGGDGQNVNSQGESESKGTIGVSVLTLGNPFFNVIAEGVKEEAAKHGYDVVVVDGDRDVQKQANQIDLATPIELDDDDQEVDEFDDLFEDLDDVVIESDEFDDLLDDF